MHRESRVHRPKRFRTVSSGAWQTSRPVFDRPVIIWSISGRSRAAVDSFLQVFNLGGVPQAGMSVLGDDGHDVGRVLAGDPFAFEYPRGWRCDRGFAFAGSSTEDAFTSDGSDFLLRIEYEYVEDERAAAAAAAEAEGCD